MRFTEDCATEPVVSALFAEEALLCVGVRKKRHVHCAVNRTAEKIERFRYIVPNAMAKLTGTTQDGKESARCLDNTGPRMYFVADFDAGTADDHAAIIAHLAKYAPLR